MENEDQSSLREIDAFNKDNPIAARYPIALFSPCRVSDLFGGSVVAGRSVSCVNLVVPAVQGMGEFSG